VTIPAAPPARFIHADDSWYGIDLRDLWEYRELLYFLVWRDVKVRYKQTLLGVAWVVLQPVLSTILFTVIFGFLVKIPSEGHPYALFAFCGLLPWIYFADSLNRGANGLIANANLISKIYFPRIFIPLASVIAPLLDFLLSFIILIAAIFVLGIPLTWHILALPLFAGLACLAALGAGLWLSALNVRYRDIAYAMPFLIQIWLYASPVVYSATLVPPRWRVLYAVNPLVAVIEGFRWSLLGDTKLDSAVVLIGVIAVAIALFSGLIYFKRTEQVLADVI